ncbi:MAG TPA: hypothetical protein VHO03_06740 [Ignavibacteriales bacterium]|nr:hypothetical protein [Ignavibacteriales bacterium]
MARIIDLSTTQVKKNSVSLSGDTSNEKKSPDSLQMNLSFLESHYPDKILFCIKEVSELLSQSYETIRMNIRNGKIHAKIMGNRKMVHRNELAKLITEGF